MSKKVKQIDNGFKHFIGYKEGEIVKPLRIILPEMSGCMNYFENGGKNMSLLIKDRYNKIWNVEKRLNIKFHSMTVYGEKYIKAKVR